MTHRQVEEALQRALKKQYPNARSIKAVDTARDSSWDIILDLAEKRIVFEVKMSNFYDALGRTILWPKEFEAAYLVVPNIIVPPRRVLAQMPSEIGVITFQIQDNNIKFEIARQSEGHQLQELPTQTLAEMIPQPPKRVRTSLVSQKALRVVRYLISHRSATQTQIARETNVSAGWVNRVVSALIDRELVSYRGKVLIVFDVWKLLNEISWNRSLKSLRMGEAHLVDAKSTEDVEAKLAKACSETKTRYALTLFSGASKYIGYGQKYDSVQAYVDNPVLILETLPQVRQKAGEGIALEIFSADSPDIIEEAKPVGGRAVCSTVQLVLDLVSYGGVGRDWAVRLYEATIAKKE